MKLYRAQGFITLTVVAEYEAESKAEAEKMALAQLMVEADDLGVPGDIEDIEVELSED